MISELPMPMVGNRLEDEEDGVISFYHSTSYLHCLNCETAIPIDSLAVRLYTYYFCSVACADKAKVDIEKYISDGESVDMAIACYIDDVRAKDDYCKDCGKHEDYCRCRCTECDSYIDDCQCDTCIDCGCHIDDCCCSSN